ncbi:Stp1/IreP family PP2C-type Ser/Thr phosphatase [Undibacterium sp. Dicai25W]|uniref:Stp1/IreP family PP2C-type Ser/Thr phosphatase n=1 Tax=Undibacterium sp. Dicai25W TaxID=3413034 RepID=UPI003BF391EF
MAYQHVLEFAALSDTGRVRDHNEDAIVVCADYGCAILADGMGGYKAGEVASAMATQVIADYLCAKLDTTWFARLGLQAVKLSRWMTESIELANRHVLYASQTNAECFGMGTTVVVACCSQDKLLLAHVGDSRAYRFRDGQLAILTHDHSVLQEQLDAGLVTEAQARFSNIKNLITRAVGTQENVDVEIHAHPLQEQDLYMLCSDGLTDMLSHDEIQVILQQHSGDLPSCCKLLIDSANAAGGNDNSSVVLFKVHAVRNLSWLRRLLGR